MTDIVAVMYDQGGVLTVGGEKGTNEKAASRGLDLSDTIQAPHLLEALKRGQINNEQFVAEVNRLYWYAPRQLTNAMWAEVYESLQPEPFANQLAQLCRDAGFVVGLLSNINFAIAEMLSGGGRYEGFEPLVLSCYEGFAKPDPEIYEIVEERLGGIQPEQILLIDDQDKCVDGARERGWQVVKWEDPEQTFYNVRAMLGI